MTMRRRSCSRVPEGGCLALLLFLICISLPGTPLCADFSYPGPDFSVIYRFTPSTGTLNDLTVIYNGSFVFHPSCFGGIDRFHDIQDS